MYEFNLLQKIIIWLIPILFAITIHETAHGWVANKLGDPTAKMLGRLTLNPIKHIDLLGTIILPLLLLIFGGFLFGWAKPVPITWQNLKHPKRDMALVAVAGPLANLGMALLWALITRLGIYLNAQGLAAGFVLTAMGSAGISINIMLFVLNLLPIPPLDGSKVLNSLLNNRASAKFMLLEPYGFVLLLLLLLSGVLTMVMMPVIIYLRFGIFNLFGLT